MSAAARELIGPPLDPAALTPAAVARALSVRAAAHDAPRRPALIAGAVRLDYAALAARCAASATAASPGDVRVFIGAAGLAAALAIDGAGDRGVCVAPLHPRLGDEARAALGARLPRRVSPGTFALLHTSGSTGAPRQVALSARAVAAAAAAANAALGVAPSDRWLCVLPLSHVGGLAILLRCLVARATAVLAGDGARAAGAELAALIAREQITLVSLVPTQLADLLDAGGPPPGALRLVVLGGAPTPPALLERAAAAGLRVATTYGMTETGSMIAVDGAVVAGAAVRIAADGRLAVRGPMVTEVDPAAGGWLETGDLGREGDGRLEILGRADDVIITGGENVHPAEVEAVIAAVPGVRAVCVFGVPDPRWGTVVACALVTDDDRKPRGLAAALARLAPFQRPRRIALVAALALGPTGKLDRRATAALAAPRLDAS